MIRFKYGPIVLDKSDFTASAPIGHDVPFMCNIEALLFPASNVGASDIVTITSVRDVVGQELVAWLKAEPDYRLRPLIYSAWMAEARRGLEGDSHEQEVGT